MRLTDEQGRSYTPVSFEDWGAPEEAAPAPKEPPVKVGMTAEDWVNELFDEPEPMPTHTVLDNVLGGLCPGLTLIGADSNVGKSVLGYEIATQHVVRGGRAIILCPDEMPRTVYKHCLASWSCMGAELAPGAVPIIQNDFTRRMNDIRRSMPDGADLARAAWESRDAMVAQARAFAAAVGDRLVVSDELVRLPDLIEHVDAQAEAGKPYTLVLIDYLQQMLTGDPKLDEDERRMLDSLTNSLKNLGFKRRIPVVALSMVANSACSPGEKPTLKAYRGSGGIGFNAFAGAVIVRAEDKYEHGDVDVWCVKNKAGRADISAPAHVFGEYSCVRRQEHTPREPYPDEG